MARDPWMNLRKKKNRRVVLSDIEGIMMWKDDDMEKTMIWKR